jgi:ferredoxin-NADP reductase
VLVNQSQQLRVCTKSEVAEGVVALDLVDPEGLALPSWEPGAHVDLVLPGGLVRQFSLCGDPRKCDRWRIAVLREPDGRGGSAYVHDGLSPGGIVEFVGPRNNFPLVGAEHYLFVAGGIGITPILPMLESVSREGGDWRLLYGGRRRRSMAFIDQLASYGSKVTIWPEDERGLLDLGTALRLLPSEAAVYCCGPDGLLSAVAQACEADGRPAPYVERFGSAREEVVGNGGAEGEEASFKVVLRRRGLAVEVSSGVSILEAIEQAGYQPVCSCREGYCGCCETDVVDGLPDHRDEYLTKQVRESGKKIMICVSRSRSPTLVLDL